MPLAEPFTRRGYLSVCLQSKTLKADLPDYCNYLHILSKVNHNCYLSNNIKDFHSTVIKLYFESLFLFQYTTTLLTFFSNLFSFSAENIIKYIYVFKVFIRSIFCLLIILFLKMGIRYQ